MSYQMIVASESKVGSYYKVVVTPPTSSKHATISCGCRDFIFRQRGKGGYCKHIKFLLRK